MNTENLDIRVAKAFYGSFNQLTSVQKHAERPLLEGADAVVLSGTGSGKTVAVLAPLVQRYLLPRRRGAQPVIVYIVPTKALGNDVALRISQPLKALGISVGLRHGDAPRAKRAHLAKIVIITPESLDVLVSAGSHFFKEVRALVIDEAHLLYNTQRGLQLGILIRRLEVRSGSQIQVVGLSATISSPKYLWKFFRPNVSEKDVAIVTGDSGRAIEAAVRTERIEGDFAALIDRVDWGEHCKILVFVNSRRLAERVAEEIRRKPSFEGDIFVHHSSITKDYRERTEKEFSTQARALCVATSTLELGIDIGDIDLIVLYGLAGGWESFLQRIGRGNRREGRVKVLCISPHDASYRWLIPLAFLGVLCIARSGGGEPVAPMGLHGALVQQIFSMLRERKGSYMRLADIAEVVSPWHHLSRSTVDTIANTLVHEGFCVRHGFQNRIGAGGRLHKLEDLRLLWGNFPARSREISLRAKGREIGMIPASNLLRLRSNLRIRFAGRVWKIDNIQANSIDVTPAQGQNSDVEISYLGKGLGIDPVVLEMVRNMLRERSWNLDELARNDADELAVKWGKLSQILIDAELPFVHKNGRYCYLTFAGTLVNDVICRWQEIDDCEVDDLCIWSPGSIDFRKIPKRPEFLADYASKSLIEAGELTIFQSMLPSNLLKRDVVEVWHRTPCYAQILQRLVSSEPKQIESGKFLSLFS